MGTLPTPQVLLDNGTGTFPTDITSKVLARDGDGYAFTRGRADWEGGVTAGTLTLTLNNSDGRFTAGSTFYGSPSPIVVDQRIRIKETVNGTTFTRFTGYVKAWPVAWPGVVPSFAVATITVVDAQARAERRVLRSVVEEEILADSPAAYYILGEPAGAVAANDVSGNQAPQLVQDGTGTSVTFGAPGPTPDATAVTLAAGGRWLKNAAQTYPATPGFIIAFNTTAVVGASSLYLLEPVDLYFNVGSALFLFGTPIGTGTYNDGAWHVVALRWTTSSTADVYIDGVLTNSAVPVAVISSSIGFSVGGVGASSGTFPGSIAHVAIFGTAPSGARLIAQSQAILTRFAGESSTARLGRLAGYAGIPTGSLDAGLTTLPTQALAGMYAWDAAQEAVDAEVGAAFVDGSGNLAFHNRNRVPAKTSPDLTLSATSYVTPDVQPVVDDQQILNYVETTSSVTGVTQVARNSVSELGDGTAAHPGHGRYSDSKSYLVSTDAEALDRANWIVANFAEPTTRYGTLTINLFAMPPAVAAQVLTSLEIDCWLRVVNLGTQNPTGTTADVIVEGYTFTATGNSWTCVCNVVLRSLFSPVWILDSTTYSVLDSTTRLYI